MCASYLDLHLETDSKGALKTKLYDKRDDFDFPIVNLPFMTLWYLRIPFSITFVDFLRRQCLYDLLSYNEYFYPSFFLYLLSKSDTDDCRFLRK